MPLLLLALLLIIGLVAYYIASDIGDMGSSRKKTKPFRMDSVRNVEEMLKSRAKEKLYQKVEERFGKYRGAYEATYEVVEDDENEDR